MNAFNAAYLRGLLTHPSALTFSNGLIPCPLGTIVTVSAKSLGLVLGDSTGRDWELKMMFVRFKATIAAAGYPVQFTSDATYGYHSVAGYTAALIYNNAGISAHAVAAAGDYGFIQCGGLNGWAVTTAAAAVAIGDILYPSGANELSVAGSDANRLKRIGVAEVVDADGGALGVGTVRLTPNGVVL